MYSFGLSPFGIHTINLFFCVADNSLCSKLSLSDLTPKYPTCFHNALKKSEVKSSVLRLLLFFIFLRALVTSFNVIFPSVLLVSSSDSDGISLSSRSSFHHKFWRKYASFNADLFFIAYVYSLVCYTIVHMLANKMSSFFFLLLLNY